MKTVQQQIADFEAKRAANVGRMELIMGESAETGLSLDETKGAEYDSLKAEVNSIDAHIARLKEYEALQVKRAVPVTAAAGGDPARAVQTRGGSGIISVTPNIEKGVKMARFVMAQVRANGNLSDALQIVHGNRLWMDQTPEVAVALKAAVAAGDTTTAGWAAELVYNQNLSSEFIELLRPKTIVGRIPGIRRVPFNIRVGSQTGGSTGYWVGQAKPIPVSRLTTDATTLAQAKAAGLLVIDEELARSSSPSAELLVRDDLIKTNATFIDVAFVDPNAAAVVNVNPASMTYGLTPVAPTGTAAADLRRDVQTLFNAWIVANVDPSAGVWIMSATTALAISLMQNALGQPEFPGITLQGGTFFGLPVITSQSANIPGSPASGNMIILMNADDVMLADDGAMVVTVSNQASIEMSDTPAQNGQNGTGAQMVSMYQTNSLAIKGVRWINWAKRRNTAVQYIREANYVA